MNCDSILECAAAWLDGTLSASERTAVRAHLEACDDCRGLLRALEAGPGDDPGLAGAVLARTSGSPCARARSLLCERIDGDLDAIDAGLLDGHLRHCADCDSLARTLAALEPALRTLPPADPGPGFVDAVLARTSRRPRRLSPLGRWRAFLDELLARPRVALEGAFIAASIIAVPLAVDPSLVVHVRGTVSTIEASVRVGTKDAWATTESFVVDRSADTLATIRQRYGTFAASRASGEASDETGAGDRRPDASKEIRR